MAVYLLISTSISHIGVFASLFTLPPHPLSLYFFAVLTNALFLFHLVYVNVRTYGDGSLMRG